MKGHRGDYKDGKWALVDEAGTPLTEYKYWFVEPWGEGYFRAMVTGSKYDLLTADGKEVFHTPIGFIGKIENGYVTIGKTIPKTKTSDTRYLYGLAHVSGVILIPPLIEHTGRKVCLLAGEYEGNAVTVTPLGGVAADDNSHLPKRIQPDQIKYFEDFCNWTFPGLQFYYRDTDAQFDVDNAYELGEVIRAGFFIDATTKFLKPNKKVRYIIASAHAAELYKNVDLTGDEGGNNWNMCTFHFNSYFKVMDIYHYEDVTQVFLLHIPHSALHVFGMGKMSVNFIDDLFNEDESLIGYARESLHEKIYDDIHPRSLDREWYRRTEHPIGFDDQRHKMPLDLAPEPEEGAAMHMSQLVHKMSNDEDVQIGFIVDDRFPFTGLSGRICERCVFNKSITREACKCDRLEKEEFRRRYIRGRCEHHKVTAGDLSQSEKKEKEALDKKLKQTFPMNEPLKIIRDFIQNRLDYNPEALLNYDLRQLSDDEEYGVIGRAFSPEYSTLLNAITAVVFRDTWPGLTYESIKDLTYSSCRLNPMQDIFGAQILDEYFKGLVKFEPDESFEKKVWEFNRLQNTIGNFMILPSALAQCRSTHKPVRTHMAKFLMRLETCLIGNGKPDYKILDAINAKKKTVDGLRCKEGFEKIVKGMFLEGYMKNGVPDDIFKGICSSDKGLTRAEYLAEAEKYIEHSTEIINQRGKMILEAIMKYL